MCLALCVLYRRRNRYHCSSLEFGKKGRGKGAGDSGAAAAVPKTDSGDAAAAAAQETNPSPRRLPRRIATTASVAVSLAPLPLATPAHPEPSIPDAPLFDARITQAAGERVEQPSRGSAALEVGQSQESIAHFQTAIARLKELSSNHCTDDEKMRFLVSGVILPELKRLNLPISRIVFDDQGRSSSYVARENRLTLATALLAEPPEKAIGKVAHEIVHVEQFFHRLRYKLSKGEDTRNYPEDVVVMAKAAGPIEVGSELHRSIRSIDTTQPMLFRKLDTAMDALLNDFRTQFAAERPSPFGVALETMLSLIQHAAHAGYRSTALEAPAFSVEQRISGWPPFVAPTQMAAGPHCEEYLRAGRSLSPLEKMNYEEWLNLKLVPHVQEFKGDRPRTGAETRWISIVDFFWKTILVPFRIHHNDALDPAKPAILAAVSTRDSDKPGPTRGTHAEAARTTAALESVPVYHSRRDGAGNS